MGTPNQDIVQSGFGVMEMFNEVFHSELRAWRLAVSVAQGTVKPALTGTVLYPALALQVHGSSTFWEQKCQAESHAG